MHIKYLPEFYDAFRRLSCSDKEAVKSTIDTFQDDPHNPILANHALKEPMIGKRAFSIWDDLRIVFREKWWYTEVLMLDVGDHMRVYR